MKRLIFVVIAAMSITAILGCSRPEKLVKGKFVFTSTRREGPGAYLMRDGKIKLLGKGLTGGVWSNDGKFIATAGMQGGKIITIFDEYGKKVKEISTPDAAPFLSWAPDDKKIAYVSADPESRGEKSKVSILKNIYIYDFEKNKNTLVFEGGNKDFLVDLDFSPLGDKLVFCSQREDHKRGIYTINIDGTGLKKISEYGTNPCWFPDGKHLFIVTGQREDGTYYYTTETGAHKASYWKVDAETGEVIEELMHEPVQIGFTPRLSRDGKYVITDKQMGRGRAILIIPLEGKYKGKNIPIYPREEFGYDHSPDWYQE